MHSLGVDIEPGDIGTHEPCQNAQHAAANTDQYSGHTKFDAITHADANINSYPNAGYPAAPSIPAK